MRSSCSWILIRRDSFLVTRDSIHFLIVKSRRELILEEIGLTPVWQLRDRAPTAAEAPVPAPEPVSESRIAKNEKRETRNG